MGRIDELDYVNPEIKIAFDIDGCCVDTMGVVKDLLDKKYGIRMGDPKTFNVCEEKEIPPAVFWFCVRLAIRMWDTLPIYPGVIDLFRRLHEGTGSYIQFITGRSVTQAEETFKLCRRMCGRIPFQVAFVDTRRSSKAVFMGS
jgi:acid phosphatase class B